MTVTQDERRNGVDTATLFATLDAVKGQHEIAKFQFRATNNWVNGVHSRSKFAGFYGAMQELEHQHVTEVESDHPAVLVGQDEAPTPVEYLLHAIAACLTAGIANIASARGVTLTKVTSSVEGDIDLLGILGLSDGAVRNGYEQIKVNFHIEGDADEETLRAIVEQSRRRSAVYDALTNPTPVVVVRVDELTDAGRPASRLTTGHRARPEEPSMTSIDTVVIGAGHAGLAVSSLLSSSGRDHVVLDRGAGGRALADRTLGLAAPAHPQLDDAASWMVVPRPGARGLPRPRAGSFLPRGVRRLVRRAGAGQHVGRGRLASRRTLRRRVRRQHEPGDLERSTRRRRHRSVGSSPRAGRTRARRGPRGTRQRAIATPARCLRAASWWSGPRPRGCRSPTSSPGRVAMSSWPWAATPGSRVTTGGWRSSGGWSGPGGWRAPIDDSNDPARLRAESSLQLIGRNGSTGKRLSRRPGRAPGPWRAAGRPFRRGPQPRRHASVTTSPSRSRTPTPGCSDC